MTREDSLTARRVVHQFLVVLGRIIEAGQLHFDLIGRKGTPGSLVGWARSGEISRAGRIPHLGEFEFHGAGCRFLLDSGEEIDVDWDGLGNAVFDIWRLQIFAQSIGVAGLPDEAFIDACTVLREAGTLVETRPGWFTAAAVCAG